MLLLDLRTPRTDLADPDRCPVCSRLRGFLTAAIMTGSESMARDVVVDMYAHIHHGHPKDPRNKTPAR
jgi:hypothetical protein